ncbi:HU family DNA-binding protein, partial [Candidatus Poribacteria bacterium]|nr:HU family DNA-binding protein [Candidatus Poribacteria bacterium]
MAKAAVPAKGMTKAQLMTHLAGVSGLSKKDIVALFEEFVTLAYKEA